MGGENRFRRGIDAPLDGSSPRGRGKLLPCSHVDGPVRLIPAWAGKTQGHTTPKGHPWAHPRVGGENVKHTHRKVTHGLIPAWAGKTGSAWCRRWREWAHPRVGGENDFDIERLTGVLGSSPRGRGKRSLVELVHSARRLIPAWAGKTNLGTPNLSNVSAHPRVGGENDPQPGLPLIRGGSSPRGRGKPVVTQHRKVTHGLIPAWAGKTHPCR